MALNPKPGLFGTDGKQPLYDAEPFWREISMNDVFLGETGLNKIIAKVGDHLRDTDIFATYKVISVDPITCIPKYVRIYPDGSTFELSTTDKLFGAGLGTASDVYRLHVNNNVYPYIACPDSALKISGSLCKYVRVFRVLEGNELEVVSKLYDSTGRFVSDMIPLELVSIHQVQNYSTKVVPPFKLTTRLSNNDLVVVYAYSDDGNVVSKRELLVEESAFVRSIDESWKYVTHISLTTPFLSTTENAVINFPLATPASSLNIKGIVHYSDGTQKELEVDGGKFNIEGIDQLLTSIEGQERDIMAVYQLDRNEGSFNSSGLTGRSVMAKYKLVVSNDNVSYSVKLYPVLIWNSDILGYSVKWYLLNMDRNLIFDVTGKVEFLENTGAFNPFGYGYIQRKQVSLNLKSVSPVFSNMNHTQVVEFTLFGKPSAVTNTAWTVKTESNANVPVYGSECIAYKLNNGSIDISVGETDYEDWLQKVYYNMAPLVDPRIGTKAPVPTHIQILYNGITTEFSVKDWNQSLSIGANVTNNSNIIITFIRRAAGGDMYLAVTGMAVKNKT